MAKKTVFFGMNLLTNIINTHQQQNLKVKFKWNHYRRKKNNLSKHTTSSPYSNRVKKKNNKLTLDLTILFENRTKFQTSLKYL